MQGCVRYGIGRGVWGRGRQGICRAGSRHGRYFAGAEVPVIFLLELNLRGCLCVYRSALPCVDLDVMTVSL